MQGMQASLIEFKTPSLSVPATLSFDNKDEDDDEDDEGEGGDARESMSHDFEVAIEEGATIVRVGSSIFGPRSQKGLS